VDAFDVIVQGSERDLQERFVGMERRMRSSIIANAEGTGVRKLKILSFKSK
jgi:hypothetical protein